MAQSLDQKRENHFRIVHTIGSILLAVHTLVLRTVKVHFALGLRLEVSVKACIVIGPWTT